MQADLFIENTNDIVAPVMASETVTYSRKKTKRERMREEKQATSIPTLAIYPNRIVGYNEIERTWTRNISGMQGLDEFGFVKPLNDTGGIISKAANKRILNAVNWLYFLSKKKTTKKDNSYYTFRVNFITLTLPSKQKHPDNYIKSEMLNDFLEWMRYNFKVKSYIWKAEAQKNGNIHFHITTNVFIEWKLIRDKWNLICRKHGYLDSYQEKFKNATSVDDYLKIRLHEGVKLSREGAKKAFEAGKKDNWLNPNSTDVHSTKKVRKMAAYMAKYLTKNGNVLKEKEFNTIAEADNDPIFSARRKETDVFLNNGKILAQMFNDIMLVKWCKSIQEAENDPLFKDRDRKTDLILENGMVRIYVRRIISGRQWFLSTNLSKVKAPTIHIDNETDDQFKVLKNLKSSFFKAYDFATVLYFDYRDAIRAKCTSFIDELIQKAFELSPVIN